LLSEENICNIRLINQVSARNSLGILVGLNPGTHAQYLQN